MTKRPAFTPSETLENHIKTAYHAELTFAVSAFGYGMLDTAQYDELIQTLTNQKTVRMGAVVQGRAAGKFD
jgi:hypothetical protein